MQESDSTRRPGLRRRTILQAGAAGAIVAPSIWVPARAADPTVLNYLSWPGNADPYLIEAFEKANGVKIRIKEYVGG
ncbi:MAG TPA: hypothetical protein VGP22_00685, partial [Albitalea sp.]|nr:hypothetical protein [Albitalea sp.]